MARRKSMMELLAHWAHTCKPEELDTAIAAMNGIRAAREEVLAIDPPKRRRRRKAKVSVDGSAAEEKTVVAPEAGTKAEIRSSRKMNKPVLPGTE